MILAPGNHPRAPSASFRRKQLQSAQESDTPSRDPRRQAGVTLVLARPARCVPVAPVRKVVHGQQRPQGPAASSAGGRQPRLARRPGRAFQARDPGATPGPYPGHERPDRSGQQRSSPARHLPSSSAKRRQTSQVVTTRPGSLTRKRSQAQGYGWAGSVGRPARHPPGPNRAGDLTTLKVTRSIGLPRPPAAPSPCCQPWLR